MVSCWFSQEHLISHNNSVKSGLVLKYLYTSHTEASAAADCFHCCLQEGQPHPPIFFFVFVFHRHYASPEDSPVTNFIQNVIITCIATVLV